jgi:hypothetical protein
MPSDASEPANRPEVADARVVVGRRVLVVGDPAGAELEDGSGQAEPRPLTQAIAELETEPEPPQTAAAALERAVDDAEEVTSKTQLALSLFTQIVQGQPDPAAIDGEVQALLELLGRLDREERWKESLELARALAKLLALLQRWLQLLRSLRTALRAAKRLEDLGAQAWALHEQGTLYLAAEKHAQAASLLTEAHDLRYRIGDAHGLQITDRNLQVFCRTMRARLRTRTLRERLEALLRRPLPALMLAASLLLVGGVAGAAIRGAGGKSGSVSSTGIGTRSINGNTGSTTGTSGTTTTGTSGTTGTSAGRRSSISLSCPAAPVPFGQRVRVSGTLTPAQADAVVTILYTPPSRVGESETQKTQADGAYQAVASAREAGEWRVASSWPGNAEYKAASVSCAFHVEPEPTEAVTITTNPHDESVEDGTDARFTAAARGIPAPTVQWEESSGDGHAFEPIPDATETTLTVKATEETDGHEYLARFSNSSGSQTSEAARLTISSP